MWVWNSCWPNYNSHLAFWCWKFRCRAAEQSVSDAPWSPLPLEWRWADKGCRHWDHLTFKLVFNSPYSPKIARAQSITPRIKRPPKYRLLVAGKVEEQQSRWELFLKNIYFCNGFITLTPKPPVQHSFPLHIILGKITFDGKKKKAIQRSPLEQTVWYQTNCAQVISEPPLLDVASQLGQSCPAPSLGQSYGMDHCPKAPNNCKGYV